MMIEILIDNKNGNVWDISNIVSGITWKTTRIGRPASLAFTLLKNAIYQEKEFQYHNGDIVRVRKDGVNVFYGYIFTISSGKDEAVSITAYDQIRYLLTNETYVFKNATATEIITQIANDTGLKTGDLVDTGYKIPCMIEDNKKLLDIICKALDLTLIAKIQNFVFYDSFGELAIRNIEDEPLPFVIGDESLMHGFDYERSIDTDTYNRVKMVQDNKETGRRDVYIVQDSAAIAKWGRLQLYQVADENMNPAQISDMLDKLIKLKNRELKSIRLNAIGDIRVRAGHFIPVIIRELGINQYFLLDECTHNISGADHTMSLELKVIG